MLLPFALPCRLSGLAEQDTLSAEENTRRYLKEGRKGKLYELKPDKFL